MTSKDGASLPAGWYSNPAGRPNSVGYWDGHVWTDVRNVDAPASVEASANPSSSASEPSKRGALIGTGIFLTALLAVAVAYNVLKDGIDDKAKDRCTSAVADRMKSPSSAKFLDVSAHETSDLKTFDEDYSKLEKYSDYSDLSRWVVTGKVDASNSYGAMIRGKFNCSAIVSDGQIVGVEMGYIE